MPEQALTVVCIGSGPSLCAEDCKAVEDSGLLTIAVNSAWQMARFCKVIYAGDDYWWKTYREDIDIGAEQWTCDEGASKRYGINLHQGYRGNPNSGLRAIQFAIEHYKAKRILLLGYDCSIKNGIHFNGSHPGPHNPDERRCGKWLERFEDAKETFRDATVINCSRETALTVFPRMSLQEALNG
jgi:hypothetical protein